MILFELFTNGRVSSNSYCCWHRFRFVYILILALSSLWPTLVTCKGGHVKLKPKGDKNDDKNSENKWYKMGQGNTPSSNENRFNAEYWNSDESLLRSYLLANYSSDVRPVINSSTVTQVNITLTIIQIMDLDEQNQVMITNAQIALTWMDQHLNWNPEDFNNITRIVLSSKDIWTPDIVLFNSADVAYSTQRDNYLIDIKHDGSVLWMFPDILRSYCHVDIKYFPFDRQNCTLELQSWSRTKKELIVNNDAERPYIHHSFIHTEWKLLNVTFRPVELNDFVWLEFKLHLKRNHAFYVNHMIFPFAILSSLTLFVFWLPPDSGEKITLTITILLALTVFLQLITEYTPKASKSLPIIGLYFNVNLILVLISVILTIIVLNFHFRGPKKKRVPRWMRKYVIGYLGRLFCFCYESKAFCNIEEECFGICRKKRNNNNNNPATTSSKSSPIHSNEKLNKNSNNNNNNNNETSEMEYMNASQQEPAYVILKHKSKVVESVEDCILLENNNNNSKNMNANIATGEFYLEDVQPKKSANKSTNSVNATAANSFNQEISRNLEKMLVKLQKSFDPFKLEDQNLKFCILKEILECQRLLLTANLVNKKEKQITINEIYDEWKILAMIVDRICFFVYLLALLISTCFFFMREQIFNDEF